MILLLISLFSYYNLFNCNQVGQANFKTQLSAQMHRSIREIDTLLRDFQQEIQKQKSVLRTIDLEDNSKDVGLLDYSITPIWWQGTLGGDQTGRNYPAISFIPTPVGHGRTNSSEYKDPQHTKNLWKNLHPFPGIQLNSSSGPLDVAPIPGHFPDHPDYTFDQPPFTFPTFAPPSTLSPPISSTRPAYPFFVPPSTAHGPSPVPPPPDREDFDEDYLPGSPSTWIGPTTTVADTTALPPSETTTLVYTLSPSPPLSPSALRGPFTYYTPKSTIFNSFMISKRMKVPTDYTPNKRITKASRIISMTHRPQQIGRILSKAQAWVLNRQWTKTSKPGRTTDGRTKKGLRTSVPGPLPRIGLEAEAETAFTGQLLQEDAHGFLYVSVPASISVYVTSPPTVAGDVLHFARNFTSRPGFDVGGLNKVYHDRMEEWDEGYMMVFLLELSRLVSLKRENEVRAVLQHAELIMNGFHETGEMAWIGERIMDVATKICGFASETATHNMGILRSYAGMFKQMLMERDTALSAETNSILDYADVMYEDDEGEALFDIVREFEEYPNPNVTKTSREICLSLIMTFLRPYQRLKTADRCRRLLDSVNTLLIQRFGDRRANEELLMLGGTATTKPNYSRERKRIQHSLKRRTSVNRHLINRTKHHDSNEDTYRRQIIQVAEYPTFRSMLPITRHQKRFRVITPKQLRSNAYLNIDRPTKDYFYRRLGRPIHPSNGMLKFFPQATTESENKRRTQPTEGKRDNY